MNGYWKCGICGKQSKVALPREMARVDYCLHFAMFHSDEKPA